MQVETGASKQPDNHDGGGDEESTAAGASNPPANDDVDDEEAPAAQPPKPEPKRCGICDKEPGKYKCPRCPLAYCSVACNKIHKENHPPPPPPDEQPTSTAQPADSNSTTSQRSQSNNDPYEVLLRHRVEFDRLMGRYPGLERILFNIQKSTLPPPDDPSANGGPQQREIWSGEVGLRRGVAALKKARTNPGILGDGVREFCELVMYLLNNPSLRGGDGGPNATSLVRQEVVADQTKVIQTLLEVEKDGDDL
ncbi:protein HIT1 [Rhypophila decipiens]|uniref:Protein HIT1 n=1 Tax=Rhypophila decipiens TaxID=261697 RepID=A0AAN6YB90_9PEZI|nr:protein HIT1 [Rhypophila decipiens]